MFAERGTIMSSQRVSVLAALIISLTLPCMMVAQPSPLEILGNDHAAPAAPTLEPEQSRTSLVFRADDTLKVLLGHIATYQYGQSRAALAELDEFIRHAGSSPPARKNLESSFLEFLGSNATLAGKQFICQRIAQIGTEASVPRLMSMLAESATYDMALSALELIGGDTVSTTLMKASRSASGRSLVGIIGVFGNRRDPGAIPLLAPLVTSGDSMVSHAALSALGKIGTPAALEVLERANTSVAPVLRNYLLAATLVCAERLLQDGHKEQAVKVYWRLNAPGEPLPVRVAALRGIATSDPSNAASLITGILRSKDTELHAAAVKIVKDIRGIEDIRSVARIFPNLSSEGQIQLLAALSHHQDSELLQVAVRASSSTNSDVQSAAFRALGAMGDVSVVPLLVQAAATSAGPVKKEARSGLYDLHSPGVDEAIVHAVAGSRSDEKVELIKAIGERKIQSALDLVLQSTKDASTLVRIECAKVLRSLAGPEQLSAMVKLLMRKVDDTEQREFETAVIATARRIPDAARQDEALLAAYPSAKNQTTKVSFIYVLGKIGAPTSLPQLRKALAERDAEVRLAAIRALSEWPTGEPYADLWNVVKSAKAQTHRTLALRGAVRLIGLDDKRSPDESVRLYRDAMKIAPNTDELKLLLSAVGQARSHAAFRLAAGYLKDENLHKEAEVAVVKIGEGIVGTSGAAVAPVLKEVVQSSKNEDVVRRARRMLQELIRKGEYHE